MRKKENGDGIKPRKDIATEDPAEIDRVKNLIYDNIKEQPDGVWYLDIDASNDFFIHDDCPKVRIGTGSYYVTVVMWYLSPGRCNMPGCKQKHKTVHDFCAVHTHYKSHEVDLSHLFHDTFDIRPSRIQMELGKVNRSRNKCRQHCTCRNSPACYTYSNHN